MLARKLPTARVRPITNTVINFLEDNDKGSDYIGSRRGTHETLKRDEVVGSRSALVRRPKKNTQPKIEKKKKDVLEDNVYSNEEGHHEEILSETEEGEMSHESEGGEESNTVPFSSSIIFSPEITGRRRARSDSSSQDMLADHLHKFDTTTDQCTSRHPSRITITTTKITSPIKYAEPKANQKSPRKKPKSKKKYSNQGKYDESGDDER